MIKLDRKTIVNLLLFVLAFAGIMYLMYAVGLLDLFISKRRLLQFIDEHRTNAVCIFIGLQALQVVFAPIPGEATGLVGGYLFGTFWGTVYSTLGLTLGSWVAFSLARLVGRPLVEAMVNPEIIQRYDYVMKHKGMFLAFLLFIIPGFPKDYLCYLLGLGHMGHVSFLLVSTSGRLFGTTLLTLGGAFFRHKQYAALFTLAGFSIFLILLVMIYRKAIEQWIRKLRAAHLLKVRNRERRIEKK